MKLITGLSFQGKLDFALKLSGLTEKHVVDGGVCGLSEIRTAPIVNQFHLIVKRMAEEQLSIQKELERMLCWNPEIILVLDLVGYGDWKDDERSWREKLGKASVFLAESADEVYQVCCGIATRIR